MTKEKIKQVNFFINEIKNSTLQEEKDFFKNLKISKSDFEKEQKAGNISRKRSLNYDLIFTTTKETKNGN